MTDRRLPADTVQFYNDGPEFPTTPLLLKAEQAYREGFATTASAVASWKRVDEDMIEEMWRSRRAVRRKAEILVPSAELFGRPDMDSEQIVYRAGHDVEAARARGKVHGLEFARQCWDELEAEGVSEVLIGPMVLAPWAEQIREWSHAEIKPDKITPPPRPEECIPEDNQSIIDEERERGVELDLPSSLSAKSLTQLVIEHPELRRPVIHGLLREGETMNVIASPKVGKSWLVNDLALAVATGRRWLETFGTEQGNVLIIDNELHRETSAHRIPKVMDARGIPFDDVGDRICVANVRGGLKDIYGLATCFQELTPDRFKLIVLDAFYRFMPRDTDENDNGTMSQLYNHLDNFAARLRCSFVLVHHSSKGNQSGKSVTDVGAGAGSQSRATDTHLVLRPHQEPNCAVLDAAVRSWPPIEPRVLRWQFPVWIPDDSLDPADLLTARERRRRSVARARARTDKLDWTPERFAAEFITDEPALKAQITKKAEEQGLSARRASRLLRDAEEAELVFRWTFGVTKPVQFATEAQPTGSSVRARTPP